MKKANILAVLFSGVLLIAPSSQAQNASGIVPAPAGAGDTRHDTPSMDQQTGDARGSVAVQAAAQSSPVTPDKPGLLPKGKKSIDRTDVSLALPDSTSQHETSVVPVTGTIALDSTSLGQRIQNLPYESRTVFLKDLDTRLAANEQEFLEVKATSNNLKGPARDTFESSLAEWKTQHHALQRYLAAANAAKVEDWEKVRSALATTFQAYDVALTRLEAASALR